MKSIIPPQICKTIVALLRTTAMHTTNYMALNNVANTIESCDRLIAVKTIFNDHGKPMQDELQPQQTITVTLPPGWRYTEQNGTQYENDTSGKWRCENGMECVVKAGGKLEFVGNNNPPALTAYDMLVKENAKLKEKLKTEQDINNELMEMNKRQSLQLRMRNSQRN